MKDPVQELKVLIELELKDALVKKAALAHQSVEQLVNETLRYSLKEDEIDFAAFEARANEPDISFDEVMRDLRANGNI